MNVRRHAQIPTGRVEPRRPLRQGRRGRGAGNPERIRQRTHLAYWTSTENRQNFHTRSRICWIRYVGVPRGVSSFRDLVGRLAVPQSNANLRARHVQFLPRTCRALVWMRGERNGFGNRRRHERLSGEVFCACPDAGRRREPRPPAAVAPERGGRPESAPGRGGALCLALAAREGRSPGGRSGPRQDDRGGPRDVPALGRTEAQDPRRLPRVASQAVAVRTGGQVQPPRRHCRCQVGASPSEGGFREPLREARRPDLVLSLCREERRKPPLGRMGSRRP